MEIAKIVEMLEFVLLTFHVPITDKYWNNIMFLYFIKNKRKTLWKGFNFIYYNESLLEGVIKQDSNAGNTIILSELCL